MRPLYAKQSPMFSWGLQAPVRGGGGVSAKCEVMPFCLKLATSKKGGGVYPFCAQLKFSKPHRGGLPWMCTSAYLPIFWACRRKFGGVLLQK